MTSLEPLLPAHARQTYSIIAPDATHWRAATCAEVECEQYRTGWKSRIDERTDLGKFQADYIRKSSGRSFTEEHDEQGFTVFAFEPGQMPFDDQSKTHSTHRIRLEREELFVVRGGDHRGNPRGDVKLLSGPQAWVDDFGEHQEKLADKMKEG